MKQTLRKDVRRSKSICILISLFAVILSLNSCKKEFSPDIEEDAFVTITMTPVPITQVPTMTPIPPEYGLDVIESDLLKQLTYALYQSKTFQIMAPVGWEAIASPQDNKTTFQANKDLGIEISLIVLPLQGENSFDLRYQQSTMEEASKFELQTIKDSKEGTKILYDAEVQEKEDGSFEGYLILQEEESGQILSYCILFSKEHFVKFELTTRKDKFNVANELMVYMMETLKTTKEKIKNE